MLTEIQIVRFLERMSVAVRQAGMVAKSLQGKVLNEGKDAEVLPDDSGALAARRAAKTVVDDICQELVLLAAMDVLNPRETFVDAEEETLSVKQFTGQGTVTLVIDPVDGTLEYLTGRDNYSICVGLVDAGRMASALVYFPVRDLLYFLDPTGQGYVASDTYTAGLENAVRLEAPDAPFRQRVYKNSRVSSDAIQCLVAAGYEVIDDTHEDIGCPDAILRCLEGEAVAYISHSRQMRDVLLGAIIGGAAQGYASNWTGETLNWPKAGRVARALFAAGTPSRSILRCLLSDA